MGAVALAMVTPAGALRAQSGTAQTASDIRLRFQFSESPFGQVLDFMARQTGLPVIREASVPQGTLTFISASDYSLAEAIEILNLNLAMHSVRLEHEDEFLYLRTLTDAARRATPVSSGDDLDLLDRGEYVTVYLPLNNAVASAVLPQLQALVKEPGAVQAVDSQNMVILVETAAQAKRIRELVNQIDAVRPTDIDFRVFPLQHAEARSVSESLKRLVPERAQLVSLDKNGIPRVYDDVSKPPLTVNMDQRLNSVIAVGPPERMATVEQLIAMLDVPEGSVGGEPPAMQTFTLETITPAEAVQQLNALFRALPDSRRPTVQPLEAVGKVLLVGDPAMLLQARALLSELDPGLLGQNDGVPADASVTRVIELEHVTPSEVDRLSRTLLSQRQTRLVRTAPLPGRNALIAIGPGSDVDDVERLIDAIDVAPELAREVQRLELGAPDPRAVLDEAIELDALTDAASDDPVEAILEEGGRTLTLVGSRGAIQRFSGLLQGLEREASVERVVQSFDVPEGRAQSIAGQLERVLRPMLEPTDGGAYYPPEIDAVDDLGQLIVHAMPGQMPVVEGVLAELLQERPGDRRLQVIDLPEMMTPSLVERVQQLYAEQAPESAGPVQAELDPASGKLLLTASAEGARVFNELLRQIQQLTPPSRTTQIVEVQQVEAADLIEPLRAFLATAEATEPGREVPEPSIAVDDRTNALLVTAEAAQHRLIVDYVRRLDRIEPTDLPPLKLLQLRTADAQAIASMLTQQYSKRAPADRLARPVEVRSDTATNTLIVSAHTDLFDEIRAFVDDLNRELTDGPERVTVLYPLKVARAEDVASAMNELYPQPPIPLDRRGVPMPWLAQPKEVTVSAEPSSNSLIIDAPADRVDSIEELASRLDRVQLPPVAELRTYRVVNADLMAVSRMLQGLARQGTLQGPRGDGTTPVDVVIEPEPASGTLIVAGDEVTFQKVEQVLESLEAVPEERSLFIVPIANAQASEVRERALEIYQSQIANIPGAGNVEVSIDEESNSLEVVADTDAMDRFITILDQLQEQVGPAREARLIELQLARVNDVIEFLRDLVGSSESLRLRGGPEPVFEPIEATNSILVAATPGQFPIIEQLVRSIDAEQNTERPPLSILRLRSTDAVSLASVLQRSYQQRPVDERTREPVDIQADAATNTLIVSAHPEVLPEIQSIVRELNDAQALDAEGREIRIFPLKHARADELARTIDEMYPQPPIPVDSRGRPRPDLQPSREIVVRADRATNALIVDAPARRLAGFEQIVNSLDTVSIANDVELRTYTITRADLDAAVGALRRLADSGALATNSQAPITIESEPVSRTVIVSGPPTIFERVESVLDELEAVDRTPSSLRMYALSHARAERLEPLVTQLLASRVRDLPGDYTDEDVEVVAERASNTLIVSAPEAVQEVAAALLESLDTEASVAGRTIVRVLPLTHAQAQEVARSVNDAMPMLELPAGGPVSVIAAQGSNAVILSGSPADLDKVEELIDPLDREPLDRDASKVETFSLEHADAEAMAELVGRVLTAGERDILDMVPEWSRYQVIRDYARQGQAVGGRQPLVEPDIRTNSVIVTAPAQLLQIAGDLIERLDQPSSEQDRSAVPFMPQRAEAARLASTVERILDETTPDGRRPARLVVDDNTGSVLVLGRPDVVAEAVRTLAAYDDRAPVVPSTRLSVFTLTNADASALARTLQPMLTDPGRWPRELRLAADAGLDVPRPVVSADPASNTLTVSAPESVLPLAAELIATLDRAAETVPVGIRVFTLTRGDAQAVSGAITQALRASAQAGDPTPTVAAEPRSNTVVVSGSQTQIDRAGELIEAMDSVGVEPGGLAVRTVFLRHARAETLAPIVEQTLADENLVSDAPASLRFAIARDLARRGQSLSESRVRVVAESRLNALVISATTPQLDLAEQIIAGLDVDSGESPADRVVRVLTFSNAEASDLATSIEAVFADEEFDGQPPTVRVDAASNSLIVRGTPEQIATIEDLAETIEAATLSSGRQLRTIPLDRSKADATEIAETIRRLLDQQSGVDVEVISVDELLAEPEESERQSRAKPLIGLHELVCFGVLPIHEAFSQPEPETQPDTQTDPEPEPAREPELRIAVDPETNSLVVVGSSRLTERVAELARQLESQLPSAPVRVRLVQLPETVDPRQAAQLVTQTVRQIGRSSDQNPGGFTGRVAAIPETSGQAIVVWANETDFATVRELIAGVARLGESADLMVKVYPLANASADRAAVSIRDLVQNAPSGRQARRLRELNLGVPDESGEVVRGTLDPSLVSVAVDPSRTAVIVTAPEDAFVLIDRFVGLLDQSPVTERLAIRRYTLEHAQAQDLSRTLQSLFDAQRQGPAAGSVPRARLVADARTNALLVTANADQHAQLKTILETADASMERDDLELAIIPLQLASPRAVQQIVTQVVIGRDPAKREEVLISAQENSGVVVVRAPEAELAEIREIVAQIDTAETDTFPIRSIKLERADAQEVATALQRFFADRDRMQRQRGNNRAGANAAIVGDRLSGTLVVAASDADYAQIESLVEQFDAPSQAQELQFRIIPLEHVRAADLRATLQTMTDSFRWNQSFGRRNSQSDRGDVFFEVNDQTNAVILFGQGDTFETVQSVIAELDVPGSEQGERVVRAVPATGVDLRATAAAITELMATPGWRTWQGPDPDGVRVQIDQQRRVLVLIGKRDRVEEAEGYLGDILAGGGDNDVMRIVELETARSSELARALDAALPEGLRVRVTPVARTNSLLLTGPEEDVADVEARIALLDVEPEQAPVQFRRFALEHAEAADLSFSIGRLVRNRPRGADEPAPSIDYISDDNTLVVTATSEEMGFIEDMIAQLDVASSVERRTDFVRLEFADAEQTADALKVFFGRFAPEARTQAERSVSIVPDPASNSLVITADNSIWENIETLLAKLDSEEYDTSEQLVVIPLKHASATSVARALNEGFRAPLDAQLDRERVRLEAERRRNNARGTDYFEPTVLVQGDTVPTVSAEPQTNSLIVFAGRRELQRIESIVRQLDLPDILRLPAPRVIPLEQGRASAIARTLQQLFVEGTNGGLSRQILIFGDDTSNSIIVRAEEDQFVQIAALAEQLEQEAGSTIATARIVRLRTVPAATARDTLLSTFRPIAQTRRETLSIEIDRDSNALVVASSDELFEQIEAIAQQLDGMNDPSGPEPGAEGFGPARGLEIVRVIRRDPAEVVQELTQLGVTRPTQGNRRGLVAEPVGLVPLREMGAIAVVASAPDLAAIQSVIETLDEGALARGLAVRVVRLELADAAQTVAIVEQMMSQSPTTGAGAAPAMAEQIRRLSFFESAGEEPVSIDLASPIQLLADRGTNSVIVSSSPENLDALERVFEQLDATPEGSAVTVKIFPLRYASAGRVRQVLLELFSQGVNLSRPAGSNRAGLPSTTVGRALAANVAVSVNERSNSIIVAGPEESVALMEVLISDLDAEDADQTELIPLSDGIRATEMAGLIRELYLNRELQRRGQDAVDLVPNERLNSLYVRGTPEDLETIRGLIQELSATNVGLVEEVRRVTLNSASAIEVVALLEDVLAGRSISGSQLGASATRVRVTGQNEGDRPTEATIDGAVRDQVTLTPDRRTNSIIIKATPTIVELLVSIIKDLDAETRGDRVIERFPLLNADALQMQTLLVDLFNLTQRGNRYVLVPNTQTTTDDDGNEIVTGPEGGTFAAVPDERRELVVTIDRRTNMLLVSGTPDLIEEVRTIVEELDSIEAVERERLVFELKNADAAEVETTLASYFAGEADISRATLGPQVSGSLLAQLEREVTIVGDPSSNKLVISASPRYVDAVTNIIQELDAAPPQVMIQVLLAEVTLDSSGQWGADLNIGGIVVESAIGGTTITESSIGGDNYSFGALAAGAGVATAFGVPNLAIASSDFGLLIRALQAQGKLEVLSRPQVQVANNSTANIQVGEDVTVPVGTVQSGDLLRAETERREVGIILEVTPTISSDGFVRMDISPEISSVSDRATQIDENFEVPIITQRRLSTTVAVNDGQSVVIGGLIQTSQSTRETKVPLLGDIPLIGGLFRSDSEERIKTELLIILTPYVIPGDQQTAITRMDELTERSLDSMNDRSTVDRAMRLESFAQDSFMDLEDGEQPTPDDEETQTPAAEDDAP